MGMSPEQRAADLYELWSKRWNDEWCLNPDEFDALVAAIRAAENEALQRGADAIGGLVKPCADYCVHDYCVAVHDARSKVLALKSKPSEGK